MEDLPDVDPGVLLALTTRFGERGPAFAVSLVETWRTETRQRLADLEAAAAAGDPEAAGRVAHAVKSGSAALGALRLARTCEDLDRQLRVGEPVDLAAAADQVRRLVDAADLAFGQTGRPSS